MQVVWEANTADFAKRKRAARACTICQKRKKRCHHTFATDSTGENLYQDDHSAELEAVLPNLVHKEPVRFVGDLNPESILTDLSSRSKGTARENQFGTWVPASHDPEPAAQTDIERDGLNPHRIPCAVERYAKVDRARRMLSAPERTYLQAAGASRSLPRATQDVLVTTYISCMDSLLPIVDGGRLLKEYAAGTASVFLIQAICLVTCKTEEATPYLRLTEDGPLMEPIPFARALHTGLDAAMKADLESDRLTKIQILALMSLHNDGPTGLEESSMHLAQAIHNAHSAGLHILTSGRRTNDERSYTWWSIWVLDKFNASLGGRAIMIADRDCGIPRPEIEPDAHARSHGLALWLGLATLLAEVISYYRPTSDPDSTGWEGDFPSFESLAYGLEVQDSSHQTCLELCYNVIAILTCRSGGPSTASYQRRVVAGDSIQRLMTTSMANGGIDHLPPMPLIPYAVSLSLTVAYRLLRDKSPNTDFERAKRDLATRCQILEDLRSRWWSADAMAKLGRKALASLKSPNDSGRAADDVVGGLMEAEVAVCKFGPFAGKQVLNGEAGVSGQANDHLMNGSEGNALDVLSTAAASLTDMSTVASSATYPPPEEMDQMAFSMQTYGDGVGMTDQFHDLDLLFGDFFDLSMPTLFEDPLFEGAAYGDFTGGL